MEGDVVAGADAFAGAGGRVGFNLADLFEIVVDAVPERECLVSGERRLTYAEVDERANRLAHWL
ncbi:MAG TPA: hypothetical protein VM618_12315, partial [Acidimicrobiia bacterium]|nr:hypothetical protein [Acidimicrobiia bacterium]